MIDSGFKSNFIGKDGFKWWIGQIPPIESWQSQVTEDGWGNRYKVRILGYHPYSKGDLSDKDLPWAGVIIPPTAGTGAAKNSTNVKLRPGDVVLGFFLDGDDGQLPMIFGSFGRTTEVPQDEPSGAFMAFTGYSSDMPAATNGTKPDEDNEKQKDLTTGTDVFVDKKVAVPNCDDGFLGGLSSTLDNLFSKVGQGTDMLEEISSATNKIQGLTNGLVSGSVESLYSAMIPQLSGGLNMLYEGVEKVSGPLAAIAAQKAMIGPIGALSGGLGCLPGKIVNGLGGTIRGLLEEALGEVVNTGACITEQFAGSLLNSINDEISSNLEGPLSGVSSLMSSGFAVKDLLSSSSDTIRSLKGLTSCNQSNQNCVGQPSSRSIGGTNLKMPSILGSLDRMLANANKSSAGGKSFGRPDCSTPSFCGPPVVNIFGGDGFGGAGRAILGKFTSNVEGLSDFTSDLSRTASIIGVELEDPGSSYFYYPPIVTFEDPCNSGYGAIGKAVVDYDPNSETYGQIKDIIMLSEGENYPVSNDSNETLNSDDVPMGVISTQIINGGKGYEDAEAEGYNLTIDNGRIISVTPINNVKSTDLPKIIIKSSTGTGAVIKPIIGRLPLTPDGEVLQIVDCVT